MVRLPNADQQRVERGVAPAEAAYVRVRRRRPPAAPVANVAVAAVVNHGRWIVECPACPGAQYASPSDRRFMCPHCNNAAAGGLWLSVSWPPTPEAIERILTVRPKVETRNWRPPETIARLRTENADHGLD